MNEDTFRTIIAEELEKNQAGLYKLLETLSSDVSSLQDSISTIEHKIELFEVRFANIDERFKGIDSLLDKLVNFTLNSVDRLDSRVTGLEGRMGQIEQHLQSLMEQSTPHT